MRIIFAIVLTCVIVPFSAYALVQSPNLSVKHNLSSALINTYSETLLSNVPFSIFQYTISNTQPSYPHFYVICQSQINDGAGDAVELFQTRLTSTQQVLSFDTAQYCSKKIYIGIDNDTAQFSMVDVTAVGVLGNYASSSAMVQDSGNVSYILSWILFYVSLLFLGFLTSIYFKKR